MRTETETGSRGRQRLGRENSGSEQRETLRQKMGD